MTTTTTASTSWDVRADEVAVGDRYRSLGRGYIGRDVTAVERKCNCQCRSRRVNTDGTPKHEDMVVITSSDGMVSYLFPHSMVVLTTGY